MAEATVTEPHLQDLSFRGFVKGLTIKSKDSDKPLCRYFGGIPYAQPPIGEHRWRKPRELAPCYRYGTRGDPGDFTVGTEVCPQVVVPEKLWDEDCLQCNIWVPVGEPPADGWPVYFYIHGGFLQFGSANQGNPVKFVAEVARCIVVKPGYRLNIFGFLASTSLKESEKSQSGTGNFGFWDLRLALEWTFKTINYFGGNPRNITVGGYSAGAHAAFHQFAFDLVQPSRKRIIRRLIMHSNGPGLPPKSMTEVESQFQELCSVLKIPADADKMSILRSKSTAELINATKRMQFHQFRAVADDDFVRSTLFAEINNGQFSKMMLASNIELIIGECSDEHFIYGQYRTPPQGYESISRRLQADYPRDNVRRLMKHYFPNKTLPQKYESWNEAFGKIYADMQIHVSQRGFIEALVRGGAGSLIYRYRIEWRAKCADLKFKREYGATHGADNYLWFVGDTLSLTREEQRLARDAFLDNMTKFLRGEKTSWGTTHPLQIRSLKADGKVVVGEDDLWTISVDAWKTISNGAIVPRL